MKDGWWPLQRVTTESREWEFAQTVGEFIMTGDLFTVVAVNDPGPKQNNIPTLDSEGMLQPPSVTRWHVVLLKGILVYFKHEYFEVSELVTGAPDAE